MQTTSSRFSLSVRAAAMRSGHTMAKLGPVLGVSAVTISYKVNGKSPWRLEEADALGKLFDVDPALMLAGPGSWLDGIDPAKVQEKVELAASVTRGYRDSAIAFAGIS